MGRPGAGFPSRSSMNPAAAAPEARRTSRVICSPHQQRWVPARALATISGGSRRVMRGPEPRAGLGRQLLYGDQAYWSEADRQACEAAGIRYRVNRWGHKSAPLSARWRTINQARSRVRARAEALSREIRSTIDLIFAQRFVIDQVLERSGTLGASQTNWLRE